jgi:hypothetical protein
MGKMKKCPKLFFENGMIENHKAWIKELNQRLCLQRKLDESERALKAIRQKHFNLLKSLKK